MDLTRDVLELVKSALYGQATAMFDSADDEVPILHDFYLDAADALADLLDEL